MSGSSNCNDIRAGKARRIGPEVTGIVVPRIIAGGGNIENAVAVCVLNGISQKG